MSKLYVIKTINMYNYLVNKGFEPVDTRPNIYIPKYIVWRFKDTKELREAMEQYNK